MGTVNRNLLESLNTKYNEFKAEERTIENLNSQISFYESFIPDFFSKTGEAAGIKNMYKNIREGLTKEKSIDCVDVNRAASIYCEYMDGMLEFINDINKVDVVTESDSLDEFNKKFNAARSNADGFIKSLYNGTLIPSESTLLSEAVVNIEYLIDFIPRIKEIKETCNDIYSNVTSSSDDAKQVLLHNSLEMLSESVTNYCYSTLKNIMETYYDINDALNSETKDSVDTFKLF